ncbi:PglL family O-oligosaccharyltransferase [Saccharospirillum salsuginis]|uniref:PglL family O-oligosaccharyltransferase n=1 Tax=Saccharospirillum salsuginis TaxID=418750 RepID=UPI00167BE76B|nr:Wzy polymerase domain-containing protein [Saccharospirillum salsuginis]
MLIGLYASLLFFMHLPSSNFGGQALALYFNIFYSAAFVPCLLIGFYYVLKSKTIAYNDYIVGLVIVCSALTIPLFYAVNLGDSLPRVIFIWLGLLLYVVLSQYSTITKVHVVAIVVASSLIQVLHGHLQVWVLYHLDFLVFGESSRPVGVFQQVNVLASYVVTGIVCSGWLATRNYESIIPKYVVYSLPLLGPSILMLVLSRSAFIGLVIGLLLLAIGGWKSRSKLKAWFACLILGFAVGFGALFVSAQFTDGPRTVDSIVSGGIRPYDYAHAVHMIKEKPVLGWGYGSFRSSFVYSYVDRRIEEGRIIPGSHSLSHPHNEFLYWAVEGGVPVLGVILAFIAAVLYLNYRDQRIESLAGWAMMVPIAVHSMFEYPFYHSFPHWFVFVALFWVATCDRSQLKTVALPHVEVWRAVALSGSLVAVLYFSTAYHTAIVYRNYLQDPDGNIGILSGVINPFALTDRLNLSFLGADLVNAMNLGDKSSVIFYAEKAEEFMSNHPNEKLFYIVVEAYNSIGEEEKVEQLSRLARLMYPRNY